MAPPSLMQGLGGGANVRSHLQLCKMYENNDLDCKYMSYIDELVIFFLYLNIFGVIMIYYSSSIGHMIVRGGSHDRRFEEI